MSHIFISYSHKDKDYAEKLASVLESEGFAIWIDHRIDYGTKWPIVIQEHIKNCNVFVVIMSPSSYESDWVQNELSYAQALKKVILPLLLEGDLPWVSVASIQYEDVRDFKLPSDRFYFSLSKHIPRSWLFTAKDEVSEQKAVQLVESISQGGMWLLKGLLYINVANIDKMTELENRGVTQEERDTVPKAYATTMKSLDDREKFQLKYAGWDNMVYSDPTGSHVGLNSERYGKSWPVGTRWLLIATEIVNIAQILGFSPEEIRLEKF